MTHTVTAPHPASTPSPGASPAASTDTATCGHPVSTAKAVKACVKEAGHVGGHSSRKYTGRRELPEVSMDSLKSLEPVPVTEEIEYGTPGRTAAERSAAQKIVDRDVARSHAAWVKAGKPNIAFNEALKAGLGSRYLMQADEEESFRAMLRSAAAFHKTGIQIAGPKKHESGRFMLYWRARDVVKAEKPAAKE